MSINKIPVELWDDIVDLCHKAKDWEVGRRLSQVNKHFRYTILGTPIPWKRLRFTLPDLYEDDNLQQRFDEWAIDYNKRAGNSVKHIKVNLYDVINDVGTCIEYTLRRFTENNTLDSFTLYQVEPGREYEEGIIMHCPRAKHVSAYISPSNDYMSEPAEIILNDTVETLNCSDVLLRPCESYSQTSNSTSLKSISIDFSQRYAASVDNKANQYARYNAVMRPGDFGLNDPTQFEALSTCNKLESLSITHTDAIFEYKGLVLPSLKELIVQGSKCNFLVDAHLPVMESLTLIDCKVSHERTQIAFNSCKLRDLVLCRSSTPTFGFNQASLKSLSFEGSSDEFDKLVGGSVQRFSFAELKSLKALNLSYTKVSLDDVLLIAERLNLEQLVCDLPHTRKYAINTRLENKIAEKVPFYWADIDQYDNDVEKNENLKQYFRPYPSVDLPCDVTYEHP